MKLYELTAEYDALIAAIEAGEIPEEAIADTLDALEGDIKVKADRVACALKNLDAEISAITAEENRLSVRRKEKQNAYVSLENYLARELLKVGMDKLETPRNRISFRKSEKVICSDDFMNWAMTERDDLLTFPTPKPNLTEIKKAIKSGEEIPGAEVQTNHNIQIR